MFGNFQFVVSLIIKTYASLGSGSAEMHGSATTVGESADVRYRMMKPVKRLIEGKIIIYGDFRVNDMLGYVVFNQVMLALNSTSPVLNEMSNVTRSKPVGEIVNDWMMMYIQDPMSEWNEPLQDADIGGLFRSEFYLPFLVVSFSNVATFFGKMQVNVWLFFNNSDSPY